MQVRGNPYVCGVGRLEKCQLSNAWGGKLVSVGGPDLNADSSSTHVWLLQLKDLKKAGSERGVLLGGGDSGEADSNGLTRCKAT